MGWSILGSEKLRKNSCLRAVPVKTAILSIVTPCSLVQVAAYITGLYDILWTQR